MRRNFFIKATLAVLLAVSLFVSCSSRSESTAFISMLDQIDSYISVGSTQDAMKELEKLEKKAITSLERLGIYKRYMILGESTKAEQVLKSAIKKMPDNKDVTAVYVQFLLRQDRTLEAFDYSRSLEGTKYASLYAEALIRFTKENNLTADQIFNFNFKSKKIKVDKKHPVSERDIQRVFHDQRFIPLFQYIYDATKNNCYLMNAASICMQQSDYAKACTYMPSGSLSMQEAFFWACVLYDSGRYTEALDVLLLQQNKWGQDIYSVLGMALSADCFYILGEENKAEELRVRLIDLDLEGLNQKEFEQVLQVVYLDSSIFAQKEGNVAERYLKLLSLVEFFPDYGPGLAAYGQFALENLRRPPEEELLQVIRKAGLKTLAMEKNDSLPVVQMEDALLRIEKALEQRKTPELVVLKEEMYEETHEMSKGEKTGRMWKLLELNESGTNMYPPEIIRFAIVTMINSQREEEAYEVFARHIKAEYGISASDIYDHREDIKLSLWEYETAAWFLNRENVEKAFDLYSLIVQYYGDRNPGSVTLGQNDSVVSALMNMAVIHDGKGRTSDAYNALNTASGRATDPFVKAEILYRLAKLELKQGDTRGAVRSLKYAITLNDNHNKARLLLKSITASK